MKKIFSIFILILSLFLSYFFYIKFEENKAVNIIQKRGVLFVGTTGDYLPMSYFDKSTNEYTGFDIALAKDLADELNVELQFIKTSWPHLREDTINAEFDVAMSGITITNERKKHAFMSDGYLINGKTVLCRLEDETKYTSLDKINNPNVSVMENPGGLNEKFARENLPLSNLIIHNVNEEIPSLIASGKADVMITEVLEAAYYSKINKKLSAPIINSPFTKGEIGILIPKKNKYLLKYINDFLKKQRQKGRLDELERLYIYVENYKEN